MRDNIEQEKYIDKEYKKESYKSMARVFLFTLLYTIFIAITFVSGSSMYPNFKDGDVVLMEKASIIFNKLDRGDVVSFVGKKVGNKEIFYIKRIIGVPGDTVEIKFGDIYINGTPIKEEYLPEDSYTYSYTENGMLKQTLGEDEYFLLGDNRENSHDSRQSDVGSVSKDKIVSKKLIKLFNYKNMFND